MIPLCGRMSSGSDSDEDCRLASLLSDEVSPDVLLAILRQRAEEQEGTEDAEEAEEGGGGGGGAGAAVIPMPAQDLITVVGATVLGTGVRGHEDGAAAAATFDCVRGLLRLADGRVLFGDENSNCIRMLSADLQQVSTLTRHTRGGGHQDGAAAQSQFRWPRDLVQLPDRRVLVADMGNHRIRLLSADLQQVSTVAGDGARGHRDGAAAQAQFNRPVGLALLPGGRVLVADWFNHRIRVLSADLQQVSTVAGDGEGGHQYGAAAQAQFSGPSGRSEEHTSELQSQG